MSAEGRANTGAGIELGGKLLSGIGELKSYKAQIKEQRKQSSLLNLSADEILRRNEYNVEDFKGKTRGAVGTAIADMGASGGTLDTTVIADMMRESFKQIDVMNHEAAYDAMIKREEAASYERAARESEKARNKSKMGTILGLGGAAVGAFAGGPAGASAGYSAGSSIGQTVG